MVLYLDQILRRIQPKRKFISQQQSHRLKGLSPGSNEAVQEVKFNTDFPFPFIADQKFSIAKELDLILSPKEIMPAIVILNKDLSVKWIQKGRNALNFGDAELKEYLGCANWI